MAWPTPQDYNEAIQEPRLCFSDPDLREGMVELGPLGMPKPYSGGFATVYKLTCKNRVWAVRCFQREQPDQQQRYAIIGEHLRAAALQAMVEFDFLPQGIRVMGKWYPVVKMEWVEGPLLHEYIVQNLTRPDVLLSLGKQWIQTLQALRQANIAHGDLQHGNVIVAQGRLKLIDYDGMYVPGLAGYPGLEDGHRNYQHPGRTSANFGQGMDGFSAWLIFLSIAAVCMEPKLWYALDAGDECLLFRRADYEQPETSRSLRALDSTDKTELRALADTARSLLALQPGDIPELDAAMASHPAQTMAEGMAVARQSVTSTDQIMQWLIRHDAPPVVFPDAPVRTGRWAVAVTLLACAGGAVWTIAGTSEVRWLGAVIFFVALASCGAFLRRCRGGLAAVAEKAQAIQQRERIDAALHAAQMQIKARETEWARVHGVAAQVDDQLDQMDRQLEETLEQLKSRLQHDLATIARKRGSLMQLQKREAEESVVGADDPAAAESRGSTGAQVQQRHASSLQRLDQIEQEVGRRYDIDIEMVQRDHAAAQRDLMAKSRKVRSQVEMRCLEIDAELDRLRRIQLGHQLDLAQAQRTVDRYRDISFAQYVHRIVHGGS